MILSDDRRLPSRLPIVDDFEVEVVSVPPAAFSKSFKLNAPADAVLSISTAAMDVFSIFVIMGAKLQLRKMKRHVLN